MSELTRWYPMTVNPVRKGWYDIRSWGRDNIPLGDKLRMAFWTGKHWLYEPGWSSLYFKPDRDDGWRGLARKPK